MLKQFSLKEIMRVMERAEKNLPATFPFPACHAFAHFLGRGEYKNSADFSGAFNQCGFACNHGCYHGVVEGYLENDILTNFEDIK